MNDLKPMTTTLLRQNIQRLKQGNADNAELIAWKPLAGKPQERAYHSTADVIGYGGAAGGGKSELGLGMAFTRHWNSAIYRLNNKDLSAIIERGNAICDGVVEFVRGDKRRWTLANGRLVHCFAAENIRDLKKYRGQARDFIVFDEVSEMPEELVMALMGWLRTTREGHQPQVLMTFNPPNESGYWLLDYFGAWINPDNATPAKDGEMKWYIRDNEGEREVPDGNPVMLGGEEFKPRSRTFFRARVQDNEHLMRTGYADQLNSLPEPLRSQLLYGEMRVGTNDSEMQCIPTDLIYKAQDAYRTDTLTSDTVMAVGVDPSRGGKDKFAIALLYIDYRFEVFLHEGSEAKNGEAGANLVRRYVGNKLPPGGMFVDVIGYGASVFDELVKVYGDEVQGVNVGRRAGMRDSTGYYKFANLRSQMWYKFREALMGQMGVQLKLPPHSRVLQELRAPYYSTRGGIITVEEKETVRQRLGRSTDAADAILMAFLTMMVDWSFERSSR